MAKEVLVPIAELGGGALVEFALVPFVHVEDSEAIIGERKRWPISMEGT